MTVVPGVVLQPAGTGANKLVAQVYVELTLGIAGCVAFH